MHINLGQKLISAIVHSTDSLFVIENTRVSEIRSTEKAMNQI
jgi:hypothetical protein